MEKSDVTPYLSDKYEEFSCWRMKLSFCFKLPVDLVCHSNISSCNPTSIMGYETERYLVITNINIRMMTCSFCDCSHSIHKCHRFDEVFKRPFPNKFV